MRYAVMTPNGHSHLDPRSIDARNYAEFVEQFTVTDVTTEAEACERIRAIWPDAIVMPVPVNVGSGKIFFLGVLPSIHNHNADNHDVVPFVALVQAIGETDKERERMRKAPAFSRSVWRVPVDSRGTDIGELDVEIRTTELETPAISEMRVAVHEGRLVLSGAVLNRTMSISFEYKDLYELLGAGVVPAL